MEILCEEVLALGMGNEIGEQRLELAGLDGAIVVPPDIAGGDGILDDELVLRRPARIDAGIDAERPALDEDAFAPL